MITKTRFIAVACQILTAAAGFAAGADWPAYKHDARRSGVTAEPLALPLRLAWQYTCAQPPAPAWPEQLGLINRMNFDYAPALVIAQGLVCFGSSADDTVRALDAATGAEKWRFTTGGPVRFAPQIANGIVYFGSDDGRIYALEAATGKPVWTFRAALGPDLMVVNHRPISRWPARSGVLVDHGVVYCVGGMLNTEGVFVYALKAETGDVLWCNDTLNYIGMTFTEFQGMGVNAGHQGESQLGGSTPQGALLLDGDILIVPNGHAGPTPLDRRTGKVIFWPPGGAAGSGGTWLTIDGGRLYTFAKHGQSANRFTVQDYALTNGAAGRGFGIERLPQLVIYPPVKPLEVQSRGMVSAIIRDGLLHAREAYGLALAGDVLLLGQNGSVVAQKTDLQTSADLRFGMAGDDLAVQAIVVDPKVAQAEKPWDGSCVELFVSLPSGPDIRQVLLVPAVGASPARAYFSQAGKPVPAPEIRLQTTPTSNGYTMAALIPLSLFNLARTQTSCRLEAQVTVGGPDGTLQRDTLFGSPRAYENNLVFGNFGFRPAPALASAGAVAGALKAAKAYAIKMRGSAEVWRGTVDGEVHDLAVAGGRLFVSTQKGIITCFEPAAEGRTAPAIHDPGAPLRSAPLPSVSILGTRAVEQVLQAKADRGFAVVVGDADGAVSAALAARTGLHVTCVLPDAAAAARLRGKWLDESLLYGTRVHALALERADALPFPNWFANVVVVAGPVPALQARELYRVLQPCGGMLLCPGLAGAEAEAFVKGSGAGEAEIRQEQGAWRVVRGKLAGALDWDSKGMAGDELVRWPLRTQWIGGPATRQIRNYREGAEGPSVGGGRYAIGSERALTGVDAYNGAVLWSRPIPQAWADLRMIDGLIYKVTETNTYGPMTRQRVYRINDDFVYLHVKTNCLRGAGPAWVKLDARTGEQVEFYGPYNPPVPVPLKGPRTWTLEVDPAHSGTLTMEAAANGMTLTLVTKDPVVTPVDSWELCFDFRPPAARYGLYERGAFHGIVTVPQADAAPRWTPGSGPDHPRIGITGQAVAGGTRLVAVFPWPELERLAGGKPASFAFAATLNSRDGGRDEPLVRRHLFGDWTSDTLNNGWASVLLNGTAESVSAAVPAVVTGSFTNMKDRLGAARGNGILPAVAGAPRVHPLTGELGPKLYRLPTACGAAYYSGYAASGYAGFYDFADDSGMRFVGGVKSRCTSPQVIANGLLIISEESGHCGCNYPFRATTALAPVTERQNEDWAFYHDQGVDTRVRQAHINLGAIGDRRDDGGRLWLGFPRPPPTALNYSLSPGAKGFSALTPNGVWMRFWPSSFQVPLDVESCDGPGSFRAQEDMQVFWKWMIKWVPNLRHTPFGPWRTGVDRSGIRGTDRPWLYASQYRGIRRLEMKLDFIKPLTAATLAAAPRLDGNLAEAAWAGGPSARLPFTQTAVFLGSDADYLYVAAQRPPVYTKHGELSTWSATNSGENAAVWKDDSFELFLGDDQAGLHFGVSASGGRYEALVRGTNEEYAAWSGSWRSAVEAGTNGLAFELAIPWKTLAEAGLKREQLGINCQMNQKDINTELEARPGGRFRYPGAETSGEALYYLGFRGRLHCDQFAPLGIGAPPVVPPRSFTVRLHFAELEDVRPGGRVFDVKIQGQTVLKDFDIVKEAGGPRRTLVKEFKGVTAGESLTLDFESASRELTAETAPILSAFELRDEGWRGWSSR